MSTKVNSFKIYTKTGDSGTSSLFTGERRSKDDLIFHALGSTDELSSHLGFAREFCTEQHLELKNKLEKIQCVLQDIGSHIATPRNTPNKMRLEKTTFDTNGLLTSELEGWIDQLDESLEPLRNFILPSGGKAATTLHIARAVCRRAERSIFPLVTEGIADPPCGKYVNRLSDFLFTAARFAALKEGKVETIYKRQASEE